MKLLAHSNNRLAESFFILLREGCYGSHVEAFHEYLGFAYLFPQPRFRPTPDVNDGHAHRLRQEGAYFLTSCFEPLLISKLEIPAPPFELFAAFPFGAAMGCLDRGIVGPGACHPLPLAQPFAPMSPGSPG